MAWVAVATAGASLVTGYLGNKAAGDAADAQSGAANAAGARSNAQYADTQRNLQPYMDAGTGALGQYNNVMAGDYSALNQSPDYLYAQQAGTQALDRGATAGGNLWGGGADADRIKLGQGLATQNLGNYMNRLFSIAGLGQNSAVSLGQFGAQNVNNQQNALMSAGNAQAAGAVNSANAWGNTIGNLTGAFGQYMGGRQSQYAAPQQQGGNWGNFTPTGGGAQYGTLGPSNGTAWNFG